MTLVTEAIRVSMPLAELLAIGGAAFLAGLVAGWFLHKH